MDKGASYIRRKRKEENFTRLPNQMLRDERLSWKARGLLAYMLSMPDDWVFYDTELVSHSKKDGITTLRTAVKELKEFGYLKKEPLRDELGKVVKWVTYIDDEPIQNTENLECGKPTMWENHNVENRTLLTTNSLLTNDDIQTTNNIKDIVPAKADTIPYELIVEHLNLKTGKNFKHQTPATRKLIKARWNEDNRLEDFKKVIDTMVHNWEDDFKMKDYLQPSTLFSSKFDNYLNTEMKNKQQFNKGGYQRNEGFKRADDVDSFKERFGVDAPF